MHSQSLLNADQYPFTFQQYSNALAALHTNYLNSTSAYPNATLLKSPRLLNFDVKKQYTPPPMLSPFRKGSGLFWTHFPSIFPMPFLRPAFGHSYSCNAATSLYNANSNYDTESYHIPVANIPDNKNIHESFIPEKKTIVELMEEDEAETEINNWQTDSEEKIEPDHDKNTPENNQIKINNSFTPKLSLMRSRLSKFVL